jgi:hypothetical protein
VTTPAAAVQCALSRIPSFALSIAPLVGLAIDCRIKLGDLALKVGGAQIGLRKLLFRLLDLLLDFGKFTLQRQRTLCTGAAAGNSDIVEGLACGGEEECMRIRKR